MDDAAFSRQLLQFEPISQAALHRTLTHCRQEKAAGAEHCKALVDYLFNCRARFGAETLRCNRHTATACVNHYYHVKRRRCGATDRRLLVLLVLSICM